MDNKTFEKLLQIKKFIGNTPIVELNNPNFKLYAKLEYLNYSCSIKDRAVNKILQEGLRNKQIEKGTTVIESSSGNFAISLGMHCKFLGLKFIAVVDPNINDMTLKVIKQLATEVVSVTEIDETGGYLLNRIKVVKEIVKNHKNIYWTNQYENEENYRSYKEMAQEISSQLTDLDYLFVSVSSCGTIIGLSKYLKNSYPNLKVIGVDIEGSMIFSDVIRRRYISGIGSSRKPFFDLKGLVHDYVSLNHHEIVDGCNQLFSDGAIFGGGSSGACYYGALKYLKGKEISFDSKVLIICPDSGRPYIDNIYCSTWTKNLK